MIDWYRLYRSIGRNRWHTLVSFIDLSRFYRFHRFVSEDASVLLYIQKWKLISCKQWICWQLSCNWESKDQTVYYFIITFLKKVWKTLYFFLRKPALKSSSDGRYWPGFLFFPVFHDLDLPPFQITSVPRVVTSWSSQLFKKRNR